MDIVSWQSPSLACCESVTSSAEPPVPLAHEQPLLLLGCCSRCDAHSSQIMPPNNATSQILRCTLSSSARLRKSEVGRSLTTTVLRFMQATPRERKLAVVAKQAPSPPPLPPQSHSSMHVFLMCIGFTVGSQWPQLNASATPIIILGTWLINIQLLSRTQSRIMQCRAAMYNFPLVVTTFPPPRCFFCS